jgi:hypothetical protein
MRYRDINTIAQLFDPAFVWVDVAGGFACDGRDHALGVVARHTRRTARSCACAVTSIARTHWRKPA